MFRSGEIPKPISRPFWTNNIRQVYGQALLRVPATKNTRTQRGHYYAGDREKAIECEEGDAAFAESAYVAEKLKTYKSQIDPNDMSVVRTPAAELQIKFKVAQDTKQIDLVPGDPSKQASIRAHMEGEHEQALVAFLWENKDIFAWKPSDMPGVARELAEHGLNVDPMAKPVKQPLWRFHDDRRKAIGEEIARLLAAGFITVVFHPKWVENPVLVMKKNGTWRMCIDYPSLNKACPKDPFVLPRIDQVIDSTAGCELLCFLGAYSGYHQIKMKEEDQEKISFITPFGAFCYVSMPFRLKNAGATYQRCIQNCLHEQIGRNVHTYLDDIVVKLQKGKDLISDLISDLEETFTNLRRYNMKLNPTKCVFGVPAGKLLGFIVSERGIEVNPEKIKAITELKKPENLKDIQRLTGCVAALSRFVSRLGEKALPLYRLLKKSDTFVWNEEADEALTALKTQLTNAPVLAAPKDKEPMLLYIAANIMQLTQCTYNKYI